MGSWIEQLTFIVVHALGRLAILSLGESCDLYKYYKLLYLGKNPVFHRWHLDGLFNVTWLKTVLDKHGMMI